MTEQSLQRTIDERGYALLTANFKGFVPGSGGTPVRISNGFPKYALTYRLVYKIPMLFPEWRLVQDRGLPVAEFRKQYWAGLDKIGLETIEEAFRTIAEHSGNQRLTLMCFEARPKDCHRGDFAIWFERQTGIVIPELPKR